MDLKEYIESKRKSNSKDKNSDFVTYLYELMDKYGFKKTSDFYNKANISRQLYSSIISNKSRPSLSVCIKFVFALELNNHECKYLLKKAGYTLVSSSNYDLIIRYCVENKIYDLTILNNYLIEYGYRDQIIE